MRNHLVLPVAALCGALLSFAHVACAATLTKCVHNSTELQNYLNAAASGTDSYVLHLRAGQYLVPSGGFFYDPQGNTNLVVEGGYVSLLGGAGCDLQFRSADLTQLDGRGNQTIFKVNSVSTTSGSISLRYLTFQNAGGDVEALQVFSQNDTSAIRVENSIFTHNNTTYNTVDLYVKVGKTYFIDNAVFDNIVGANLGQAAVVIHTDPSQSVLAYVNNNTIAGNRESNAAPVTFGLVLQGSAGFDLANNILWNGGVCDVTADASTGGAPPAVTFDKDDIASYCSVAPQAGAGTIQADPLFANPALGNYRLQPMSPAVDTGDNTPPGTTLSFDVDGLPRVVHNRVDLGAYELPDFIFADGFD